MGFYPSWVSPWAIEQFVCFKYVKFGQFLSCNKIDNNHIVQYLNEIRFYARGQVFLDPKIYLECWFQLCGIITYSLSSTVETQYLPQLWCLYWFPRPLIPAFPSSHINVSCLVWYGYHLACNTQLPRHSSRLLYTKNAAYDRVKNVKDLTRVHQQRPFEIFLLGWSIPLKHRAKAQ